MTTPTGADNTTLFEQLVQLVHATIRPLPPRFGDGRYNSDVFPQVTKTGILKDLGSQIPRVPQDIDLIIDTIGVLIRGGYQDDSKFYVPLLRTPPLHLELYSIWLITSFRW